MNKFHIALVALAITLNLSAFTLGEVQKEVIISGDNGGLASDGSAWDSKSIKDKVYVMFYVDPDEKDTNEHFTKALKAKQYNIQNYGSIAIVNLAATWKPNFVIEKILKSKQEEFPNTIYVKDKASVLVNEWGLPNDASNVLLFDKDGKLLFVKSGAMSDDDMKKIFTLIESHI
jgi:predicted transcriptional regulator